MKSISKVITLAKAMTLQWLASTLRRVNRATSHALIKNYKIANDINLCDYGKDGGNTDIFPLMPCGRMDIF